MKPNHSPGAISNENEKVPSSVKSQANPLGSSQEHSSSSAPGT